MGKSLIVVLGLLVFLSGCAVGSTGKVIDVEMYKPPTCECCGEYAKYLETKGFNVKTIMVEDPVEFKRSVGVPEDMMSCHTLKVGKYFVEGHVPVEAIQKLMKEQPDIDGIALPGMPQGSPGMPGVKAGPFVIYSISKGEVKEFTRT